MVRPDRDGDFSGIDPQQLWNVINSIKNRTGSDGSVSAAPLVTSWMSQANKIGLDTTRLGKINRHFAWAQDQLPMLRRRHSLAAAAAKEEADFGQTGMVGDGSGDLGAYKTQEAAQKAGKDAAKKYKDGDLTMQQYMRLMQQNENDPDFAAASCKELGTATLTQMENYSSALDPDNPKAGHLVFANFVATSMRGGMHYKDFAGHEDISFLAPLVTNANFPAAVLTDLGTQALAPGNAIYSDQIWKALAADPKAATQFVQANISNLPSYLQPDSERRNGSTDANAEDFAAVLAAAAIPGAGSADSGDGSDPTMKLAQKVPVFLSGSNHWAAPAIKYGNQVGVDPQLILSIAMLESIGKQEKYGRLATETENELGIIGSDVGAWPHGGASLGITNIKKGIFNEVSAAFPDQFRGKKWEDLVGDDDLDIKTTAYYVKYLKQNYVAKAPAALTNTYSENQLIGGIYNGGESNYVHNVLPNGSFGPLVSQYVEDLDAFYGQAGAIINYEYGVDPNSA